MAEDSPSFKGAVVAYVFKLFQFMYFYLFFVCFVFVILCVSDLLPTYGYLKLGNSTID